jgi:hypothetical protein
MRLAYLENNTRQHYHTKEQRVRMRSISEADLTNQARTLDPSAECGQYGVMWASDLSRYRCRHCGTEGLMSSTEWNRTPIRRFK